MGRLKPTLLPAAEGVGGGGDADAGQGEGARLGHDHKLRHLAGVAWAIVFAWWYRDDPRAHPGVNAAEAALLPPPPSGGDHLHVPWRRMATSRTVWCLCGQYAAMSYAWYFFVTWFPTYLLEVWKFDLKASATLAGLPLTDELLRESPGGDLIGLS